MLTHTTDFIVTIERRIAALNAAKQAEPASELERWVAVTVRDDRRPLAFDIDAGRITTPRTAELHNATRFNSHRVARSFAQRCKDGNGDPVAKAMRLRHAYCFVLDGLEQTLASSSTKPRSEPA